MSAEFDLDRVIGGWIRDEAPAHAPDRVLETVMGRVDTTSQRRPIAARWTRTWSALSSRRRLVVVGLALLALLAGLVVVGAVVTRLAGPPTPALVVVQPDASAPQADELTFSAVEADGSRRELGRMTTERLGGEWGGWPIVLSPDGHVVVPVSVEGGSTAMAVFDLRDPSAPVQRPDFEAGFGSWSPDGRLAGVPNRGGVAIFDPATGGTTFSKAADENTNVLETDFRAQWAADGSGVLAATFGDRVVYGVLAQDGTFRPGQVAGFDGGLGPRRVRADGARLQCSPGDNSPCEPPTAQLFAVLDGTPTAVWTEPATTVRIIDFAWGADGTVWFLTETLAAGPRTVQLVHVDAAGVRDVLGTYDGPADDPEENSYFPAASFLTLAPDDSRVVVRVAGDQGSPGRAWVVDPKRRTSDRLDGTPIGWLSPTTMTSERPPVDRLAGTDDAVRGAWIARTPDGPVSMTIRRAMVETTSTEPGLGTMTVESTGPDTIRVGRLEAAAPCDPAAPGTYRWVRDDRALTLTPVDDPCASRSALLARTFDRELPTPDTGSVTADAGATYVAGRFAAPFEVSIPASASATIDQHSADAVSFSGPQPAGTASLRMVVVQDGSNDPFGLTDPCEHHGATATFLPGIEGTRTYIKGIRVPGLDIGAFEDATVAGLPGVSAEIRGGAAACPDGQAYLFGSPGYLSVGDARLYLFEPVDGTVVAITTPLDVAGDAQAWIDELLGSISFAR